MLFCRLFNLSVGIFGVYPSEEQKASLFLVVLYLVTLCVCCLLFFERKNVYFVVTKNSKIIIFLACQINFAVIFY